MKASKIKKIRAKMKPFLVLRSDGMFGDFKDYYKKDYPLTAFTLVTSTCPREAAKRYMKRTNTLQELSNWDKTPDATNEMFAKLKVVPADTPFERHITYWK